MKKKYVNDLEEKLKSSANAVKSPIRESKDMNFLYNSSPISRNLENEEKYKKIAKNTQSKTMYSPNLSKDKNEFIKSKFFFNLFKKIKIHEIILQICNLTIKLSLIILKAIYETHLISRLQTGKFFISLIHPQGIDIRILLELRKQTI